MNIINIFDTYENADSLLGQYVKDNWKIRDEIDERAKVISLDKDCSKLGKGLELTCAVELEADDTEEQVKYIFNAILFSPDNNHGYHSIPDLVQGAGEYLKKQNKACLGARVSPFFYTVKEKPGFTEEQKSSLRDFLPKLEQLIGTSPQEKKELKALFEQSLHLKRYRGLTAEERKEVEKLYNQ